MSRGERRFEVEETLKNVCSIEGNGMVYGKGSILENEMDTHVREMMVEVKEGETERRYEEEREVR